MYSIETSAKQTDKQLAAPIPYGIIVPVYTFLAVLAGYNLVSGLLTLPVYTEVLPSVTVEATQSVTRQPPTAVSIPKIEKYLPIQAATVQANQWQLFETSVSWLSTSAVPGEGNVILYAHNWRTLWGDLDKLQPGDTIVVEQNGISHHYTVFESRSVLPTDIDAILSENDQLTLYTCEGVFDQKRRVVYAQPANLQQL